MKKQLQEVGKIIKTHQLHGAVKVKLLNYQFVGQRKPNFLYLNNNKNPLPYFVDQFDHTIQQEYIIRFEDWNNREAANKQLKGQSIFIDVDEPNHQGFQQVHNQQIPKYSGYQLFDQHKKYIGEIDDVYEIPENTLLAVNIHGKEVLIPVHQNLLIEVKDDQKEIHLQILEGLVHLDKASTEEE